MLDLSPGPATAEHETVADESDHRSSAARGEAKGDDRSTGTHTLKRALAILRAFDGHAMALSNAQLVRRTGYSKASVSRITATLVGLGYLSRDVDGVRFRVGVRGRGLGLAYRASSPLANLVRPLMQAFAARHDMSVALGIGDGTDMLYVEYCKSPGIATLCLAVGSRIPMETTALGRAYLWGIDSPTRQRLLADIAGRGGRGTAFALARTGQAIESIDRQGYCTAIGEYQRDSYGIAVPVRAGRPEVPMALSCCGIRPAPDDERIDAVIAPALKATARSLTEALHGIDSDLF